MLLPPSSGPTQAGTTLTLGFCALLFGREIARSCPEVFVSGRPLRHLPWSTESENDRRVVVVAVVLAHRADLPSSVEARP